jgi:hypothetical protein
LRRSNYDLSTALVAIGAVAVLVSLFLDWYGDPGLTAFDAFEITDWLLVALAVGALVVIGTESWSGGGTPNNRLAWISGTLAFLVVAQLLDPPPAGHGADREIGAWLALGGAVLMVAGAVLALAEISVTIDVAERERRRRTAAVDARADGEDASEAPTTASPAPGRGSGLWQAPSAEPSRAPSAPTPDDPSRSAPPAPDGPPPAPDARSSTPSREPKAPPDDPERTQPLKPTDRPDRETEAAGDAGDGDGDAKP